MYTFYTEGGQPNLALISTFSLLYSIPVVMHVPLRQPPVRLPLPRRDQGADGPSTGAADQGLPRRGHAPWTTCDLTIEDGEFFALLGPSGLRQDDAAADDRGPGDGHRRVDRGSATATSRRSPPGAARRRDGLPGLRAVPAHDGQPTTSPTRCGSRRSARAERAARPRRRARGWASTSSWSAARRSSPAASSNASRWPGRWPPADVFLFDEPLSNLDARLRLEARTFLKKLQHDLGVTTVFVTHDQAEALALADRIAVMEAGRIRQLGTPAEVFQRPGQHLRGRLHRLHADEPDPRQVRGGSLEVSGDTISGDAGSAWIPRGTPDGEVLGRLPSRVLRTWAATGRGLSRATWRRSRTWGRRFSSRRGPEMTSGFAPSCPTGRSPRSARVCGSCRCPNGSSSTTARVSCSSS